MVAELEQPTESEQTEAAERHQGASILAFPTRRPPGDDSTEAEPDRLLRDVLGEVLREERLAQERTLAEVAEDAAVSLPYLSEIERGTKEVSSDLLDAVIHSLDLELAEVLERSARRLRVRSQRHGPTMRLLAA